MHTDTSTHKHTQIHTDTDALTQMHALRRGHKLTQQWTRMHSDTRTHVDANVHTQTQIDVAIQMQSEVGSVCGWTQPQDASRHYTFVQGLLGCTVYVFMFIHSLHTCIYLLSARSLRI